MKTKVNELRKSFLDFFEGKGHLSHSSYSLIPHNDKSLLLINAGMAPLKPYFTGQEVPPNKRMATCQKCIRTGDIDNVGKTARHLTFFEMLGNFSFGDYFKKEAIAWSWEFLTKTLGLDESRLYPSIYGEDEEAFDIWTGDIGVPAEKITRFYRDPVTGECDNFWEHGAGPCGPCSEIYYDRGEKYGCGKPDCKVGCDCDRFMEVWNNVFTQFDGDGKGGYTELANKNIDTGMGLERLAVVMQDVDSVFDIDTMKAIRDRICELSGKTYGKDTANDVSIRLITDHIRSSTFMICDGVLPSNEGRGYVLRRLIRRAARHGRILGIADGFMADLSKTVIAESKDGYPDLVKQESFIHEVLSKEESQFYRTIDQGLAILSEYEEELSKKGEKTLSGEKAFKLYDTFGFPIDLTIEILQEKGYEVDMDGFHSCMETQKTTARAARKTTTYMGTDSSIYDDMDTGITTEFIYGCYEADSVIKSLSKIEDEGESFIDVLAEGEYGGIITEKTPLYATKGGQQHDIGTITGKTGTFQVEDVINMTGDRILHVGYVSSGSIKMGEEVTLNTDTERRADIAKNHSATHLLHKALKVVLGDHVNQAGSDVSPDRLRFDFTHFSAMSPEEVRKVETIVNEEIAKGLPVETKVMDLTEAKSSGAEAHFDEKYGEHVRVVSMGDFSKELCGGTHVSNTGEISAFKIISENGISSGVRRMEALTGKGVFKYFDDVEVRLNRAASLAKTNPTDLPEKVLALMEEVKRLTQENEKLKAESAKSAMGEVGPTKEIKGVTFISKNLGGVDAGALRTLGDELRDKNKNSVIVLASCQDGKVNLMVTASDEAQKKGAHAGNLIKSIASLVGGGGGGRPNMAMAGGKNPEGIEAALQKAEEELDNMIN